MIVGMIFLHPVFLWGLLAVLIPIAVHLFNFRRYRKVYFSNVDRLNEVKSEKRKVKQLRRWLVLLMRCLAIVGLVVGVLLMTALMLLWNWLITPIYMGQPREFVATLLIPYFLPFNLIKGGINATLTVLLYKPIVNALRKAKLVEPSSGKGGKSKLGVAIVALVLLITFAVLALVLAGII